MYRLLLLSLLCFNTIAALAKTPREATRAMLRLMPSNKDFLPQLKQLVAAGADLQAVDKQGMNILHRIALWHGQDNAEAAAYLVDQLHTDYANWHETPLFLAIYSDNLEVVRVLADHYDFDQAYDNTSYPLLHALKYNSHNVAKFLLTRGVNVEIQNKHGHTPLHIARGLEIVSLLLDKGLDVNAVTNSGMTPLHIAMSYNDLAVIELLLASGANPDSKGGRSGMSPLHYAKSPAAVELILAAGGDVNISSSKHKLRPAHTVSNVDTLKALALNGANLNAQDVNGGTPLDQAVLSGKSSNLINALQIYGAAHSRQGYAQVRAMAAANTKPRDDHPKQEGKPKQQEQQDDEHDEHNDELDYLLNLNEVARKQSSNPVIGRTLETEQVLNTLKRKFMRGAVLVGDAGVGKTALIEGIAYQLANNELPEFAGSEIYALDVGSMWGHADSKWVGQLHKRVNAALKFIAAEPDKRILFIDEIHQLLGGGSVSARGSPPIADIIKPYLGRGDIKLIGSTTHDEYQRIIEHDRAIASRLLRVDINSPSAEETLAILRGLKSSYEQHYGIVITDPALRAAVNLADRYIADQQHPRKAIDLLDEAAASLPAGGKRLTKNHVATAVAKKIGIAVATIQKSKNDKAVELLAELQQHIFGQNQALEEIDSVIKVALADLVAVSRPLAALLLVGPTGVGKTETTKIIAKVLLDREDSLISVDMSGYKHPSSVAELTELLTRAVKEKRHAVILLDELEKAHAEVRELLLQLLDEGRLTDNNQRQVDFTNTIIIATTNSKKVDSDFAPELLNRFDKLVEYQKLALDVSMRLVQKQLIILNDSLKDRKIRISISDAALKLVASSGYDGEYGAREMARVFAQLVKYPLADAIARGLVRSGQEYQLDLHATGDDTVKAVITTDDSTTVLATEIPHHHAGNANSKKRMGF